MQIKMISFLSHNQSIEVSQNKFLPILAPDGNISWIHVQQLAKNNNVYYH